jgi:hypothetical protein
MPRERQFLPCPPGSDRNGSRFYKNSVKVVNPKCLNVGATIERGAVPLPGEFPTPRNLQACFAGSF